MLSFVSYLCICKIQTSKFGDLTKEQLGRRPISLVPLGAKIIILGFSCTFGLCCNGTGHMSPRSVENAQLTAIAKSLTQTKYLGSPITSRNYSYRRCVEKRRDFCISCGFSEIYKGLCSPVKCCVKVLMFVIMDKKMSNSFWCFTFSENTHRKISSIRQLCRYPK